MALALLGIPICLIPLALYLFGLVTLNTRRVPTLVPGPWDFAGVLFGLAGFLLFGGPVLLTGIESAGRRIWLHGAPEFLPGWWLLSYLYLALILGGAAWLLFRRRRVSVVYNVTAAVLEASLVEVLGRYGLVAGTGARYRLEQPAVEVELDAMRGWRHGVLTWRQVDPALRHDIERALVKELAFAEARTEAADNPLASWLMSLACGFGLFGLFSLGLFIFLLYRR